MLPAYLLPFSTTPIDGMREINWFVMQEYWQSISKVGKCNGEGAGS